MEYGISLADNTTQYDAVILAVAHSEFLNLNVETFKKDNESIIYDLKAILDPNIVNARL